MADSFLLSPNCQVLLISCLLEEDAVKDVSCRINDLNLVSRRNLLPNGNPYWRTSLAKAQAISDHLHQMYSTLSHRHASRKKALKRELIKSQLPPDKGKGERFLLRFCFESSQM